MDKTDLERGGFHLLDGREQGTAIQILHELRGMRIGTAELVLETVKQLLRQVRVPDDLGV